MAKKTRKLTNFDRTQDSFAELRMTRANMINTVNGYLRMWEACLSETDKEKLCKIVDDDPVLIGVVCDAFLEHGFNRF